MSARDVMAAKLALWGYDEAMSGGLLAALTAAGFSIVHKDEIHAPSVERCAQIAERDGSSHSAPYPHSLAWVHDTGQQTIASDRIAAALRELMKEVGR